MVTQSQSQRSKAIQRRTGRTFHVATRFLPKRVRETTYILYAFFRIADEVVDDPDPEPPDDQRERLDHIEAVALGTREPDDPVLAAFAERREEAGIPDQEVKIFLDAMRADVDTRRYETYEDLQTYLRGSAVAVAYMMLEAMDPPNAEEARSHASALGRAFQLTNFLRDVREDITDYGRVYLPAATMDRFGVTDADLTAETASPGLRHVIKHELERTEEEYRHGLKGIQYLPTDCQFPVLLASVLYAEHHAVIRKNRFDVLASPPSLGYLDYARLVAKTWWHWRATSDPLEVFYRVSAVPRESMDVQTQGRTQTCRLRYALKRGASAMSIRRKE